MTQQGNYDRPNVIRIVGLRATQTTHELKYKGMDVLGVELFGPIEPPQNDPGTAFAVAASMLASGRSVYHSKELNAISTDPTFGATPSKRVNFDVTKAVDVESVDGIWLLPQKKGRLVLTLEDGSLADIEINEANAFIGWMSMAEIGGVTFDGTVLAFKRSKWPADRYIDLPTAGDRPERQS